MEKESNNSDVWEDLREKIRSSPQYRQMKDLPVTKSGTIWRKLFDFNIRDDRSYYLPVPNGVYESKGNKPMADWLSNETVENNPDWFRKIEITIETVERESTTSDGIEFQNDGETERLSKLLEESYAVFPREFRLLKQFPWHHEGMIFRRSKTNPDYYCEKDHNLYAVRFSIRFIEENPDWFQEISCMAVGIGGKVYDLIPVEGPRLTTWSSSQEHFMDDALPLTRRVHRGNRRIEYDLLKIHGKYYSLLPDVK